MPLCTKERARQYTRRRAIQAGSRQVLVTESDAPIPSAELPMDHVPLAASAAGAQRTMCMNYNRHIPDYSRDGRWSVADFRAHFDDADDAWHVVVDPAAYRVPTPRRG